MALVTLCPDCGTTFRVNAVQLQAHSGDVRCGHCQQVFNGFATLITVSESVIEYPSQFQSSPISEPEALAVPVVPTVSAESFAVTANADDVMDLPIAADSNQTAMATSDDFLTAEEPRKQSQGRWGAANVFLLLLLIGQIAYINRTELTIIAPGVRPYLERYCAIMACTVPYPQDIKQLGIEASDLQKNILRQPEVAMLSAIIRNHAPFPQALPALQLSLLDEHDQVIVSRIFTAQDYLQEENKSLQFIAAQHEIEIRLDFDSSNLDVLGYRLLLLYL
ncbi:zinc-ribbon and DUF3426 domain-containing protein [Nitrosomonas sp.]|uniref:zinc-ribbon and DUF3426 domain-containing protein n=1 Tax=Nitrosomonas sp. TaxID=42353 RepID=UPI00261B4AA1|nr:zinc-ribbon and DUF3426 domain-containing protein [Nitrosomonas sp.]